MVRSWCIAVASQMIRWHRGGHFDGGLWWDLDWRPLGVQVGLALLLADGNVFRCHHNILDAVWYVSGVHPMHSTVLSVRYRNVPLLWHCEAGQPYSVYCNSLDTGPSGVQVTAIIMSLRVGF